MILPCKDIACFLCVKDKQLNGGVTTGCVKCGTPMNVDIDNVSQDLTNLINNLVGNSVWLYKSKSGDGHWMFDPKTTKIIEKAYLSKIPGCSYMIGMKTYSIVFKDDKGEQQYYSGPNDKNPKRREVVRVKFTKEEIKNWNIKGISGVFFKTIEEEIGKFVI